MRLGMMVVTSDNNGIPTKELVDGIPVRTSVVIPVDLTGASDIYASGDIRSVEVTLQSNNPDTARKVWISWKCLVDEYGQLLEWDQKADILNWLTSIWPFCSGCGSESLSPECMAHCSHQEF